MYIFFGSDQYKMRICDECRRTCHRTPFGSCVYVSKTEETLCIDCISFRREKQSFQQQYKFLKYLRHREIHGLVKKKRGVKQLKRRNGIRGTDVKPPVVVANARKHLIT